MLNPLVRDTRQRDGAAVTQDPKRIQDMFHSMGAVTVASKTSLSTPKYRKQKRPGRADQAFVELSGQRHYLGEYGNRESKQEYRRLVGEWLACGGKPPVVAHVGLTVTELLAEYWRGHAGQYTQQRQYKVKSALRPLKELYGHTQAREFGPLALKTVRSHFVTKGLARKTVNEYTDVARHVFKWAVGQQLVEPNALHGLQAVDGLRRSRTVAHETEPVRPVPQAYIDAIEPHVSRQVWALIQLQLATAARPGELVIMRPIDVGMTGRVWAYKPITHKTAHHGHDRTIYIGPRGQDVLGPFLTRPVDAYLFDPREAIAEQAAQAPTHRRANQKPNPRKTDRVVGDHYDVIAYRGAIQRGCDRAGVPRWSPNQLRHSAGTAIRKEFGLEAAQVLLGHARADTTQIYAEINEAKALEVAAKIG